MTSSCQLSDGHELLVLVKEPMNTSITLWYQTVVIPDSYLINNQLEPWWSSGTLHLYYGGILFESRLCYQPSWCFFWVSSVSSSKCQDGIFKHTMTVSFLILIYSPMIIIHLIWRCITFAVDTALLPTIVSVMECPFIFTNYRPSLLYMKNGPLGEVTK